MKKPNLKLLQCLTDDFKILVIHAKAVKNDLSGKRVEPKRFGIVKPVVSQHGPWMKTKTFNGPQRVHRCPFS
ncbi:MAG: hypothetical protein WA705_03645 [Candidatus Ozemobacteraceae bacterium]